MEGNTLYFKSLKIYLWPHLALLQNQAEKGEVPRGLQPGPKAPQCHKERAWYRLQHLEGRSAGNMTGQ